MVIILEVEIRSEQVLGLRLVHIRCHRVLQGAQVVESSSDVHVLKREGGLYGVLDELEE